MTPRARLARWLRALARRLDPISDDAFESHMRRLG
jgi:hypothetical protein